MIKIAVLGYGTVGAGIAEVIRVNQGLMKARLGQGLEIKYVLDPKEFPKDFMGDRITHDFEDIAGDEEIKIVAEAIGGETFAYTYVKRSLLAGKSVVTSNKALVAAHGAELLEIAKEKNVNFLFEASVGGGIPILRALYTSLAGEEIQGITGILNGTTNYILTKMFYEGEDYAQALLEAQEKGYAERNPEADVEGRDACRKIAILSSLISGYRVDFGEIYCEGITRLTPLDMRYARAMGMTIKPLALCRRRRGGLSAMTAPFLLGEGHPLFSVDGVFNAVFVQGNMLGDAMFYGSGAGKLPTASAVVGDIMEEAKNLDRNLGVFWRSERLKLEDKGKDRRRFFVRIKGEKEEWQERAEKSFGMLQFVKLKEAEGEFGLVTTAMPEEEYEKRAQGFEGELLSMIRVEE